MQRQRSRPARRDVVALRVQASLAALPPASLVELLAAVGFDETAIAEWTERPHPRLAGFSPAEAERLHTAVHGGECARRQVVQVALRDALSDPSLLSIHKGGPPSSTRPFEPSVGSCSEPGEGIPPAGPAGTRPPDPALIAARCQIARAWLAGLHGGERIRLGTVDGNSIVGVFDRFDADLAVVVLRGFPLRDFPMVEVALEQLQTWGLVA